MKLRKNNQVQSSIKGLSPTRALWNFTDGTQENPWRVWAVWAILNSVHFYKVWFEVMTFLSPNTDKALRENSQSQKEHEALRLKLLGIMWVLCTNPFGTTWVSKFSIFF